MKRQNVRTLALIICTFTYLLVGAAVFDALESEHEISERLRLGEQADVLCEKYHINATEYQLIVDNVIKSMPYRFGTQWKFSGALFFSTTVITTIGYGYSTPKTSGGKIFCMFYALTGIPLNLVMFQSIGERLNIFVTFALRQFKKCFRFKTTEVSQTNLILVCMNMSSVVVAGGAWVFCRYESWPYLDSIYYCIITLTTIGFGDMVALQRNEDVQSRPEYFVFSLIFILFGLAVLSAAMNLLVLRFLTMNTEDERKDELQAFAASQNAVRLDGDIITSKAGCPAAAAAAEALLQRHGGGAGPVPEAGGGPSTTVEFFDERASVCSCTCYNLRTNPEGTAPLRWLRRLGIGRRRGRTGVGYSGAGGPAGGSIIAQLLQPVKVLQAMTQVHSNRDARWRAAAARTVFGARRNSI